MPSPQANPAAGEVFIDKLLCDMGNKIQLLSVQTDGDRLVFGASMQDEIIWDYNRSIRQLTAEWHNDNSNTQLLLAIIREQERLGDFLTGCNRHYAALVQYAEAAHSCLNSTELCRIRQRGRFAVEPVLRQRFFELAARCREIVRSHPHLADIKSMARLNSDMLDMRAAAVKTAPESTEKALR